MNITIQIDADTISIVSAVIAFLSMIIACHQTRLAKKSLKMEKEIFNDRKPNYSFDSIVDCYAINDMKEADVHLYFLIMLTNRSDRPMSIHRVSLVIRGESHVMKIQPKLSADSMSIADNIDGNHTMRKWVQFDLPREQYLNLDILDYTIEVQDAHGSLRKNSTIFLREEVYAHEEQVETESR